MLKVVLRCREAFRKTFYRFCILAGLTFLSCFRLPAQELPAGTRLEVRLWAPTGSRLSHQGDPVEATIIAPISEHGRILVPQGATLLGSIAEVHAMGLGLKHSTASLSYDFHTLRFRSGATIAVKTQLIEVETAKEHVDRLGTVHGMHPIVSLSSNLSYYTFPLLLIDPAVGFPILAVKALIAPSANPEINFPAGTELILRLMTAVEVPAVHRNFVRIKPLSLNDAKEAAQLLKTSAPRAYIGERPSDIVNLMLIGSRAQINRAFQASGWSRAQRRSVLSLYRMYHALCKRHGYSRAPMNTLTLSGVPSAFVHQKSLDTVEKRHHARFWQSSRPADFWLGTAAEDVGFRFELTHWTHFTDPDIDSERAKVVNDLAFTGCVAAAGLLPRAPGELKLDLKAKHPIVTDGKVAVVQLNDCDTPTQMVGVGDIPVLPRRGRLQRTLVAFRDDLVRTNVFFTTYNTLKLLARPTKERAIADRTRIATADPRKLDWLTAADHPAKSSGAVTSGVVTSVSDERGNQPE